MRAALLSLVTACTFGATSQPSDGNLPDLPIDQGPPLEGACVTYSTQLDTCAHAAGSASLSLAGDFTYDTDDGTLVDASGMQVPVQHEVIATATGELDVVFVTTFTLAAGSTLRAVGPNNRRPLGIAASGAIDIAGVLDVSNDGAGARGDTKCASSLGKKGTKSNQGAGGGGGGAFQGAGGSGGTGNADGPHRAGGAGGMVDATPTGMLGGCDGGRGGDGASTGGRAGDGGGAILIASGTSITIESTGVVDAGGSGGFPGAGSDNGGGGGGAGGMILLESLTVTVQGVLAANGGGGGEGDTNGLAGQPGQRSATPAAGGSGGDPAGGDGAPGGTTLDGVAATDLESGGGGGGGGGVGFIFIACPSPAVAGATISPAFAPWP